MQDLKVIGVENGALVAVGDDGERFRIAVDEALQSKVRQVRQETPADAPKLSPREVQAHIQELILGELSSNPDEPTPPQYEQLVERYYQVLATAKKGMKP